MSADNPEWRVALVRSSSTPTELVPWLADDAASQRRVERHHSFVRWLSEPNGSAKPAEINMNDRVYVRLTDTGRGHIEKAHHELFMGKVPFAPTKEDADGWSEWQLWDLMQTLGDVCFMGGPVPFETAIRLKKP